MMSDTRAWTSIPSASSGGNRQTIFKLASMTALFGALVTPFAYAVEADANGRTPVKVAKQFMPSLPVLESQQDEVKVSLSDRGESSRPTNRTSLATPTKPNDSTSLSSRPAELVKRPASKVPSLSTAREKPSTPSVEIAVHQPVASESSIQVAETPYLVPSDIQSINVSKFELPPKVQLAEPPALLDDSTSHAADVATDTMSVPKQPILAQPIDLIEPTLLTQQEDPAPVSEQAPPVSDPVTLPAIKTDNTTLPVCEPDSSSTSADSIAIQRRKSTMKTFANRVTKVTSENEAVCKAFLVDSMNVAFLGIKDGQTYVTMEFADGASLKQQVRVESSPSPATGQNEEEKIANLEKALRDLYPKSELRLAKSTSGAIIVQGKLATEQDARDAMILVRQMFLVPIQDKLTVGTK